MMTTRISDVDRTFAAMDEMRRRMDRVFEEYEGRGSRQSYFEPFELGFGAKDAEGDPKPQMYKLALQHKTVATWPRLSVYDTGASLVLYAEVPGLKETDLKIEVAQNVLSLSGERKADAPDGYAVHRRERVPVKFARTLALPCKVDVEKASATVTDGVLTLTLPKSPEAQTRQIAVKAAS
jgi:HSP20 family protein